MGLGLSQSEGLPLSDNEVWGEEPEEGWERKSLAIMGELRLALEEEKKLPDLVGYQFWEDGPYLVVKERVKRHGLPELG